MMLLHIIILKFLVFSSKFRHVSKASPRLDRWIQDGLLQLQRRVYEAASEEHSSVWVDLDKEIPLTTTGAMFSDLPLESVPRRCRHSTSSINPEEEKANVDQGEETASVSGDSGLQQELHIEQQVDNHTNSRDVVPEPANHPTQSLGEQVKP